ncbi:MAG TPA: cupin domain-containing protein [Candidatus Dormibacteraeota bacterium]
MASELSKPGLALVRQSDVPFTTVVQGLEISRGLTQAGFTSLGGGWVRMDGSGELKDWTLKYDETLFVVQGEAEVEDSSGKRVAAGPGEAILIGEGTTVTYRGKPGTEVFFVLNPRNWDKRDSR